MGNYSALSAVVLVGTIITFAVHILLALAAALLIQQSLIPLESANVLLVVMGIVSALVGSLFCRKRSGKQIAGYACAVTISVLFLVLSFTVGEANLDAASIIRTILSIFVGAFLGNFFGKLQHNKLRKTRKKKAVYTK